MENNTFKSVTFGGFAKQDVIDYIEKTSKAAAEQQEQAAYMESSFLGPLL